MSSTAATVALARESREGEGLTGPAAAGVVLATAASAAAQVMIVAVLCPGLVPEIMPVLGAPILFGALAALAILAFGDLGEDDRRFALRNPVKQM